MESTFSFRLRRVSMSQQDSTLSFLWKQQYIPNGNGYIYQLVIIVTIFEVGLKIINWDSKCTNMLVNYVQTIDQLFSELHMHHSLSKNLPLTQMHFPLPTNWNSDSNEYITEAVFQWYIAVSQKILHYPSCLCLLQFDATQCWNFIQHHIILTLFIV